MLESGGKLLVYEGLILEVQKYLAQKLVDRTILVLKDLTPRSSVIFWAQAEPFWLKREDLRAVVAVARLIQP